MITILCQNCGRKQNGARNECYNCAKQLRRKPTPDPLMPTPPDPYVNEDRFIVFDPTNKRHMRQVSLMLWGKL